MDYLGLINAEGGPIIVGDALVLSQWTGVEGTDYDRACALFDADPKLEGAEIKVGMGDAIVWEMEGGGTAFVFRATQFHHIVVRLWPTDPLDKEAPHVIADQPFKPTTRLGALPIESGILAILWAAEDGTTIELPTSIEAGHPTGEMALEDAGLVIRVTPKAFVCFHDRVETPVGIGRRLHLVAE